MASDRLKQFFFKLNDTLLNASDYWGRKKERKGKKERKEKEQRGKRRPLQGTRR
ncbi:hypothetical protein WN51_03158 [Melipona quadrifasciata]|uniref:Uncharacterized protein n=1 Tax=Melipona quadrifasciata TaxID=166423 RepID=A0A0M8ZVK1_9HYME|nr:hypothetical protein WN51_03158 [Melipona quadrifasciata]